MASTQLALRYDHNTKPSTLLNSVFMTTLNTASRALQDVVARVNSEHAGRWKLVDHVKYMYMLTTWMAVGVLRVLIDNFPVSIGSSNSKSPYLLEGLSSVGSVLDNLASFSSSKSRASTSSSVSSLDLVLYQGSEDVLPDRALGKALSHILALLNQLPATSRKYQFALAMADRIIDENARDGREEVVDINRTALASAFARTTNLLYRLHQRSKKPVEDFLSGWTARIIGSFPLGSYLVKGLDVVLPLLGGGGATQRRPLVLEEATDDHVIAEKHAQELLWLTNKMRFVGVVDEALVQWSFASGLASISLTASPRVQGFIVKISAILFGELARGNVQAPSQVKFRLLALWVPLFCFAENGLSYPILSNYEKAEVEKILNQLIGTLPVADQQIILTNWLQDFTITTSDWPNLQLSYDRWCHSTRKLVNAENVNLIE